MPVIHAAFVFIKGRIMEKKQKGKHKTTLSGLNELGRLLNMRPGDVELFLAPHGFKKKMSSLGAYFHRIGGSHLFSQSGVIGIIASPREVIDIVRVTRLEDPAP